MSLPRPHVEVGVEEEMVGQVQGLQAQLLVVRTPGPEHQGNNKLTQFKDASISNSFFATSKESINHLLLQIPLDENYFDGNRRLEKDN